MGVMIPRVYKLRGVYSQSGMVVNTCKLSAKRRAIVQKCVTLLLRSPIPLRDQRQQKAWRLLTVRYKGRQGRIFIDFHTHTHTMSTRQDEHQHSNNDNNNDDMSKQYRVTTGRGGMGNIQTTSEQPQVQVGNQGSQTPNLLQPVFSTGRGGAGNMHKNTDPSIARKLQDVDQDPEDHITPIISGQNGQNNTLSIGRGGFGNMISPKNSASEDQNTQRGKTQDEKKSGGFLSKAKGLFKSR